MSFPKPASTSLALYSSWHLVQFIFITPISLLGYLFPKKKLHSFFTVLEKMRFLEVNVHKHHNLAHCLKEEWFI